MATIPKFAMLPQGEYDMTEVPEAAGQSFAVNEVVRLDANGKVEVAPTDATAVYGIAAKAATGVEDTPILVYRFKPGSKVEANITNAGADVALAQTHMAGTSYELYRDATNKITLIDVAASMNSVFIPVETSGSPRSKIGDTNARVIAVIDTAAIQAA